MKNQTQNVVKKIILASAIIGSLFSSSASWAYVNVNGYFRSSGTYVQPYIRSNPDGNPYNNLGYQSFLENDNRPSSTSPFQPVSYDASGEIA